MSEPVLSPVIFSVIMIVLIIINAFSMKDLSGQHRRRQVENAGTANDKILSLLKKRTDKKVKFKKRQRVEATIRQAGMNWRYEKFYLCKILCGGILCGVGILFNNIPMAICLAICGIALPYQIISFKRNSRMAKIDKQIGPFLQMVTKRYLNTRNLEKALISTRDDLKGIEPLYSELEITTAEIDAKIPIFNALEHLSERTENKFLKRFANFYKISADVGTADTRKTLMEQAYLQFEEDRSLREFLKKEIAEPKRDAMIVMAMAPVTIIFGCFAMDGYLEFMFNSLVGQILFAVNFLFIVGTLWLINTKLAAPVK